MPDDGQDTATVAALMLGLMKLRPDTPVGVVHPDGRISGIAVLGFTLPRGGQPQQALLLIGDPDDKVGLGKRTAMLDAYLHQTLTHAQMKAFPIELPNGSPTLGIEAHALYDIAQRCGFDVATEIKEDARGDGS